MPLQIHQFPCRSDNYGFLAHDPDTGLTASIDTPDGNAINAGLTEKGWQLSHILNTHHHVDHTEANLQLKEQWACTIIGAAKDAERIPGIDIQVANDEEFSFGAIKAKVLEVPGHTSGHIAFYFATEGIAFVGDTLFALGCGRLFEGTPSMMWTSLQKLMTLPNETSVYCGHEYTEANAKFALTIEPANERLKARCDEINALRANNLPTVPTTIGLERATNPFVRPASKNIQTTIGLQGADALTVFSEIRRLKDNF